MYLLALLIVVAVAISFYYYNSLRYDYHKLRLMLGEIRSDILKYSSIVESLVAEVKELSDKTNNIRDIAETNLRYHRYSGKTMRLVLLNTRFMYNVMNNGYKSKYIKHNVSCSKTINARHSGKYAKNEPSKIQLESLSNLASDKELEGKGTTVKLEGKNTTTEPKTGQELKDSTDNLGDWL